MELNAKAKSYLIHNLRDIGDALRAQAQSLENGASMTLEQARDSICDVRNDLRVVSCTVAYWQRAGEGANLSADEAESRVEEGSGSGKGS